MKAIEILERFCVKSIPLVTTYVATGEDYPMHNPGRCHHGLLYTVRGAETYRFGDKAIEAVPHSVLYIPKGERYSIEMTGEESVVVCMDFELAEEEPTRPFTVRLPEKNGVASHFSEAVREHGQSPACRSASLKSLFYRIVSLLLLHESTYIGSTASRRIASAIEHLHAHFTDAGFGVEALAEKAGMSRRYFEKLFFGELGVSPHEYILRMKMELARELLLNERLSVGDVAGRLGYSDVYHFSKIFKQRNRMTPTEYKREARRRGE